MSLIILYGLDSVKYHHSGGRAFSLRDDLVGAVFFLLINLPRAFKMYINLLNLFGKARGEPHVVDRSLE